MYPPVLQKRPTLMVFIRVFDGLFKSKRTVRYIKKKVDAECITINILPSDRLHRSRIVNMLSWTNSSINMIYSQ